MIFLPEHFNKLRDEMPIKLQHFFITICHLDDCPDGCCKPAREIGKEVGKSTKTIYRWLSKLADMGLITITKRGPKSDQIRVVYSQSEMKCLSRIRNWIEECEEKSGQKVYKNVHEEELEIKKSGQKVYKNVHEGFKKSGHFEEKSGHFEEKSGHFFESHINVPVIQEEEEEEERESTRESNTGRADNLNTEDSSFFSKDQNTGKTPPQPPRHSAEARRLLLKRFPDAHHLAPGELEQRFPGRDWPCLVQTTLEWIALNWRNSQGFSAILEKWSDFVKFFGYVETGCSMRSAWIKTIKISHSEAQDIEEGRILSLSMAKIREINDKNLSICKKGLYRLERSGSRLSIQQARKNEIAYYKSLEKALPAIAAKKAEHERERQRILDLYKKREANCE